MSHPADASSDQTNLRQIKLILAYNGTGFSGWQSQPDGSGIQDHLEKALHTVLRTFVRVTGASRTDTGVHAEYQVVTFRAAEVPSLYRLIKSLNALLPLPIRIRDAEEVPMTFHPNRSSRGKIYRYQIWRAHGEHPFVMPYVWKWSQEMDVQLMKAAAAHFVGEHDFTSFCATDSSAKTRVRNVRDIRFVEKGPLLEIWFVGEGFLKQMVRTMVGTLVAVGLGKKLPTDIIKMMSAKDRKVVPSTAPAEGLCLVRVVYDEVLSLDALLKHAGQGYNLALDQVWQDYS